MRAKEPPHWGMDLKWSNKGIHTCTDKYYGFSRRMQMKSGDRAGK